MLEGFSGYLQCDGYSAYGKYVRAHDELSVLGCMAHARRKFKEAEAEGEAPLSILRQVAELYAIEKRLRKNDSDVETIYTVRQEQLLPVLEALYDQLLQTRKDVPPAQPDGQGLRLCPGPMGRAARVYSGRVFADRQ